MPLLHSFKQSVTIWAVNCITWKLGFHFFFGLFWKSVELLSMLSRNMKLGNSLANNLPLALIYNAVIANTITLVVIYLSNLLEILYLQFIQDEAVQKVVEFMDTYSLSQEDFDTIVEISKFKVGNYSRSRLMFILCNVMFTWPSLWMVKNYFCIDNFQFSRYLASCFTPSILLMTIYHFFNWFELSVRVMLVTCSAIVFTLCNFIA